MLTRFYIINFLLVSSCVLLYTDDDCASSIEKRFDFHGKSYNKGFAEKYTSCFENLGCISTTEEWYHDVYRPRNLEPLDRHTIKTEFILITKNNLTKKNTLKYEIVNLKNGNPAAANLFKADKQLLILIHDFTSNGYTGWIKHLSNAIIKKSDVNVVSVDWQSGAEPPYEQAISNARVVALEIVTFLNILEAPTNTSEIHLIGHGIGAHIAGYVGHSVAVTKITGLDPTGPYFEHMPAVVRLDPSDATFVEVLHTDAFDSRSQGATTSLGHIDFYINGANLQPLCNRSTDYPPLNKLDRNSLKEGTILPGCSHKRSFKYYIEYLRGSDCEFLGFKCDSYQHFVDGKCTGCSAGDNSTACVTFGGEQSTACQDGFGFYLNTGGTSPYCMHPYRVTFVFEHSFKDKTKLDGNFEMIMVNSNGIMTTAYPSNRGSQFTFDTGKSYVFIYYANPPRILDVSEIKLKWVRSAGVLCSIFCKNAVYVRKIVIENVSLLNTENNSTRQACVPTGKNEIRSGTYSTFKCASDVQNGQSK